MCTCECTSASHAATIAAMSRSTHTLFANRHRRCGYAARRAGRGSFLGNPFLKAPTFIYVVIATTLALGLGMSLASIVKAQEETPTPVSSVGLTRADPAPLGAAVQAGPVELQILYVLNGADANGAVLAGLPTKVGARGG